MQSVVICLAGLLLVSSAWGKEKSKKVIYDASDKLESYYTYVYNEFGKDKKYHYDAADKLLSYYDSVISG